MRFIPLLLAGAALASCSTADAGPPPESMRSPSGERAFASVIGNKVPGRPVSCIPQYNQNDMVTIDGQNVAFRVGTRTAYLAQLSQGCGLLGSGHYALLTRQFGGTGLCRGDIAQVVDVQNRITVGSCTVTEIVPYSRP